MNTITYKLEKGDTVRVTGCHGMLFNRKHQKLKLADGITLGIECVLMGGQNEDFVVQLPNGILADGMLFIHMACVELVKKGEHKPATIEHNPACELFEVKAGADGRIVSQIWYDDIPKEVAEICSKVIKEAYDAKH